MSTQSRALCLCVLGLLTSGSGIWAQEPGPQTSPVGDSVPAEDLAATRILHLSNGGLLRLKSRPAGASWEVLQDLHNWQTLPEGTVLRAVLEHDVLAEAKRLQAAITTGPKTQENQRRVGLAEWMLTQGLTTEALTQFDRVLASDPDHPQALASLGRLGPKINLAGLDPALKCDTPTISLLLAAANSTASVREIAVQRLGASGGGEELRLALRAQLTSHSPRLRSAAALALRRIHPGKELKLEDVRELINRSVLDGAEDVRLEAARALRDVQDPAVAAPALRALNSRNPKLRENSIQALGVMGYRASVEPLITYLSSVNAAQQAGHSPGSARGAIFIGKQTAYVQDFDVEVAQFSAVADPQINVLIEGSVLDARVIGMYSVSYSSEARDLRTALGGITGQDLGNSNRAWLEWWEKSGAQWKNPPPPRGTETEARPAPAPKS